MRIIAGEAKGRRIATPSGKETRPTSDRVKESLFNILGIKVPGAKVLDLFAGSGNIGLEAISRGADSCVFIDNSKDAVKIIRENINFLKYEDYCEVYSNSAIPALEILKKRNMKFDIVFVDPPYHKNIIPVIIEKILETEILQSYGIVVSEHDIKDIIPPRINNMNIYKTAIYGNTAISLFKKMEE